MAVVAEYAINMQKKELMLGINLQRQINILKFVRLILLFMLQRVASLF